MMFTVSLQMTIWDSNTIDGSKNWASGQKTIELPFAPTEGLELHFQAERRQKITTVRWHIGEDRFTCLVEDEFTTFDIDDPVFEDLIEYYKDTGWTIEGPHPNLGYSGNQ